MLFTSEQREAAKAELLAGGANGKAAGVAAVAKLVGQKWAALSDEEKQQYKERAQQLQGEKVDGAAAGLGWAWLLVRRSCSCLSPPCRPAEPASLAVCCIHAGSHLPSLPSTAAEAAAAAAAQGPDGEAAEGGEGGEAPAPRSAAPPPPFGFPTSLVKRIVLADDEISRVSADALRAICKAAELFVGQLAVRALEHAQSQKKKNFKAADIEHLAGRDR